MWIEALEPLVVRLPTGSLELDPGQPVEVVDAVALTLVHRAPEEDGWLVVREHSVTGRLALIPAVQVWGEEPH